MYIVTIINDTTETIINEINGARIKGNGKNGINTIDYFSFDIYPSNPGFDLIYPLKTKVTVYNTITEQYDFVGRALAPLSKMESGGAVYRTYDCESELAYLLDSVQSYGEYHDLTVRQYLEIVIDKHNSLVEASKQFLIGEVTISDSLYRYTSYASTYANIKDDLLDKLGGILRVRYDGELRYLDYLATLGDTKETSIRLGHNQKSISESVDISTIYTRIIPLGAKLTTTDEAGNSIEADERLTIASVNGGLDYLDYADGVLQYGIIQGFITYDDVTEASTLLARGNVYIANLTMALSTSVSAYDLSLIGVDADSLDVYNYYPIYNDILNISYTARIISKSYKIESPEDMSFTLGTQKVDIKTYNALKSKKTEDKINDTIEKLKTVKNSIGVIADDKVDAYDEVLNQTALLQKLTVGGYDGLYLDEDGNLFIKGTYVSTGIIASVKLVTGSTTEPVSWINLDDGSFSFGEGAVSYNGTDFVIQTSKGYTFSDLGLSIDDTAAPTKTLIDDSGIKVIDKTGAAERTLLEATVTDGTALVKADHIEVTGHVKIGANCRFEDYGAGRTGAFYVGD